MPAKRSKSEWTRQKIVNRIRALYGKGEDLSYNRMARHRQGLLAAANYHFGSWAEAVNTAGIDYEGEVRRIPKWSRERIVAEIKEATADGADLSWTNVTRSKDYSALAYAAIRENQFGSWDAALAAAGLDPADVRRYESWSEEKIVRRIKERAGRGEPLNSKAMQEHESKLFNAALNYFGGWDKALRAAGIKPEEVYKRRRWSEEIIKKEIKALHASGEDLAAPGMRRQHSALYSAACKYFGSWSRARKACGIAKSYGRKKR
jgi:hypothetical protein